MSLTPLTITRRNIVPLNFATTTLISGATGGSVLYNYSINAPYLWIAAFGGDSQTAGPPNYPERYSNLFINSNGQPFGVYYDTEVRNDVGGTRAALTRAGTAIILTNANNAVSPPIRYYKSITADTTLVALQGSRLPSDGTVNYPTNYVGVTGGGADAFLPVYNISATPNSIAIMAINTVGQDFRLFTQAGAEYKAFQNEAGFFYKPRQIVTLNSGGFNYSILDADPTAGNSVYASKWTAVTTASAFSATNYKLSLSNAADDALFQASADNAFANFRLIRGNYEAFIYNIVSSTAPSLTTQTAFVIAKDFSWYDRIDVTSDGSLLFGTYHQDINGNHFLEGKHASAGTEAFQRIAASSGGGTGDGAGDGTVDTSVRLRVWGYSLDGHDYYVLRVGPSDTLVYDLTTGKWSEWQSPGRTNWRAHVGQNWVGMATTTFARAFGSDVVAGDDASGVLWILDPTYGRDDRSTTSSDKFDRVVTSMVAANGRQSIPCNAIQLTCALGNPSQTGASITLETSDDLAKTWTNHGSKTIVAGGYDAVIEWRGVGQITAPGRVFRFTDDGASVRYGRAEIR